MIDILSYGCMGIGLLFWFWGTFPLVGKRSVLFKLHSLSVSDTLGSMSIVVGLLLKIPSEWPLLVLALISLAIWNTVLGYVLAYCSSSGNEISEVGDRSEYSAGEYGVSEYGTGGYE
ncbi:sodium:proton antiporter [filamentous cyanobacterium CCP2]|nr:sodium:proton antiporter [filamentous cyanobacterium CCP2]